MEKKKKPIMLYIIVAFLVGFVFQTYLNGEMLGMVGSIAGIIGSIYLAEIIIEKIIKREFVWKEADKKVKIGIFILTIVIWFIYALGIGYLACMLGTPACIK